MSRSSSAAAPTLALRRPEPATLHPNAASSMSSAASGTAAALAPPPTRTRTGKGCSDWGTARPSRSTCSAAAPHESARSPASKPMSTVSERSTRPSVPLALGSGSGARSPRGMQSGTHTRPYSCCSYTEGGCPRGSSRTFDEGKT